MFHKSFKFKDGQRLSFRNPSCNHMVHGSGPSFGANFTSVTPARLLRYGTDKNFEALAGNEPNRVKSESFTMSVQATAIGQLCAERHHRRQQRDGVIDRGRE
ncbi:hypothetical protein ZHAS_00006514 [Anopheles sinensis]|uniref:Uncharacterized protein n=1 Tax=Anopheles sinensis TaxID=74873 RepID=A0A084VMI3_ANOSI|nr:hypothetical protein ZHAS_00006514 [Anopheles sinensis]